MVNLGVGSVYAVILWYKLSKTIKISDIHYLKYFNIKAQMEVFYE